LISFPSRPCLQRPATRLENHNDQDQHRNSRPGMYIPLPVRRILRRIPVIRSVVDTVNDEHVSLPTASLSYYDQRVFALSADPEAGVRDKKTPVWVAVGSVPIAIIGWYAGTTAAKKWAT